MMKVFIRFNYAENIQCINSYSIGKYNIHIIILIIIKYRYNVGKILNIEFYFSLMLISLQSTVDV